MPAAYDAFLRGWEHYRRTTPEDYAKAIPHFEKAIELDPGYYRAHAALSMIYMRSYLREWATSLGISGLEALLRAKQYLREAQKQPNALAHQAAGYALIRLRQSYSFKEALVEFKEAIALDPGDSWSYALAALALVNAGRQTEAMPYINTAMRLDPHPPPLFLFYLGLTQFGLKQFEDAAASLEAATRLSPDDQYPFLTLGATYGHLGRKQDAAAVISRYNALEVAQGGVPVTLSASAFELVENPQLKEGLRLAGVPESLSRGTFAEQNRLSADEVRSLVFGHRLGGRSRKSGRERSASLTKEGVAAMSGDWVTGIFPLTGGVARFKGDDLCLEFAPRSYCGPVLRNPGGTRAHENEYIWHLPSPLGTLTIGESFRFSVVE